MGRLAGGVAHDFNNLLGVILNYVTLIEKQQLADQVRHDVAQMREATERGAALTQQLLTFARREPARTELIDVGEVVRSVATLLERTLGPAITLELNLSPEPLHVLLDRQQLDQVVVNLAINSRDAMPRGGHLVVSTAWESDDELPLLLRIRDTGTGMSPDVVARVFEPFFTTKPRGQGTGLGLSTVYGIVSRAGGRISIDSLPGEGTTFNIRLPASKVAASETVRTDVTSSEVSHRNARILLVDDDLALRDATRRTLRDAGYDVRVASDGREALDVLADLSFGVDVVVSDVVMPRLTGTELAEHLRQHAPRLPLVLMTGHDSASQPFAATVLLKPVDGEKLLMAVEEALRDR